MQKINTCKHGKALHEYCKKCDDFIEEKEVKKGMKSLN